MQLVRRVQGLGSAEGVFQILRFVLQLPLGFIVPALSLLPLPLSSCSGLSVASPHSS